MPGGRHLRTPTISSTAAAIEATSMKQRPSSQMSAPMPDCSTSVVSGGYMNQPPLGRRAEKNRAGHEDAADQEAPEAISREARERQVARRQHLGQDQDRERLEQRHREQEHHHAAMQREQLVVEIGRHQIVVGHGQLRAHQKGEPAREQHECEGGRGIPEADLGVVDRRPVAPAAWEFPDFEQALGLGLLTGAIGVVGGLLEAHSRPSR